jgi:hypothetical protein
MRCGFAKVGYRLHCSCAGTDDTDAKAFQSREVLLGETVVPARSVKGFAGEAFHAYNHCSHKYTNQNQVMVN